MPSVTQSRSPRVALRRDSGRTDAGPAWAAIRAGGEALLTAGDAIGVIVFGSLARRESSAASDVDVVVVLDDRADPGDVRRRLKAAIGDSIGRLTPLLFTADRLIREARRRPTFAAHLVAEGVVVVDSAPFADVEAALVKAAQAGEDAIETELTERTAALDRLSDLRRFNGEYVPTLSQLYSLARSVVIARLLQEGVAEYSWRRMFHALAERRPELTPALERLQVLRPYFDHIHGRARLSDDEQRIDPAEVTAAIDAIRTIAAAGPR